MHHLHILNFFHSATKDTVSLILHYTKSVTSKIIQRGPNVFVEEQDMLLSIITIKKPIFISNYHSWELSCTILDSGRRMTSKGLFALHIIKKSIEMGEKNYEGLAKSDRQGRQANYLIVLGS